MSKTLIKDILSMNGYEVLEAERGTEALELLATRRPDIILMDINLPGMDGVTAARLIKSRQECRDIPVLALTASAMKGDEERILEKGFDGYVAKPIDVKKLLNAITEKLRQKKS